MQQPISLSFDTPLAEAARTLLAGQSAEILEQVRLISSPDLAASANAVHDLRVALRRSLTLLGALSPWLDDRWRRKQNRQYRGLLRSLGRVRDLDVLAGLADAFFCHDDGAGLAGGPLLLVRLQQKQAGARQKLQDHLTSGKFTHNLAKQVDRLSHIDLPLQMMPQAITAKGEVRLYRIGEILPVVLYAAAAQVTVYHTVIRSAGPGERIDDLVVHQLRIAAKNFRYLIEHGQSLLGPPARQLIREFRTFQDSLGNWHDAVVACAALTSLESSGWPAEGKGSACLTDEEKEAVRCWLLNQENQRDNLLHVFLEQWPSMTPAWFHEHLSAALDCLYSPKAD